MTTYTSISMIWSPRNRQKIAPTGRSNFTRSGLSYIYILMTAGGQCQWQMETVDLSISDILVFWWQRWLVTRTLKMITEIDIKRAISVMILYYWNLNASDQQTATTSSVRHRLFQLNPNFFWPLDKVGSWIVPSRNFGYTSISVKCYRIYSQSDWLNW